MLIRNGASEARNEDGGGIEEVPLHVLSLHLERRDWPGRVLEGVFEDDEAEVVVCNQTAAIISRAVLVQFWGRTNAWFLPVLVVCVEGPDLPPPKVPGVNVGTPIVLLQDEPVQDCGGRQEDGRPVQEAIGSCDDSPVTRKQDK